MKKVQNAQITPKLMLLFFLLSCLIVSVQASLVGPDNFAKAASSGPNSINSDPALEWMQSFNRLRKITFNGDPIVKHDDPLDLDQENRDENGNPLDAHGNSYVVGTDKAYGIGRGLEGKMSLEVLHGPEFYTKQEFVDKREQSQGTFDEEGFFVKAKTFVPVVSMPPVMSDDEWEQRKDQMGLDIMDLEAHQALAFNVEQLKEFNHVKKAFKVLCDRAAHNSMLLKRTEERIADIKKGNVSIPNVSIPLVTRAEQGKAIPAQMRTNSRIEAELDEKMAVFLARSTKK